MFPLQTPLSSSLGLWIDSLLRSVESARWRPVINITPSIPGVSISCPSASTARAKPAAAIVVVYAAG